MKDPGPAHGESLAGEGSRAGMEKLKERQPTRPSHLSLGRKMLFSGLLMSAVLLVGFAGLEAYLRFMRSHLDLWALTGRRPGRSPMAKWAYLDAFCAYRGRPGGMSAGGKSKTINRHGFISTPDIEYEKEDGEIRIAFLGGSSTAGTGKNLADDETWPWKCAETVRARFPDRKVSFINAALGGYSSFESYGRLWSRLRFFKPDIVVVYHGWNEMYYFRDARKAREWRTRDDGQWGFDGSRSKVIEPMWLDPILRYSQLLTRVRRNLGTMDMGEVGGSEEKEVVSHFDDDASEVWRTNLRLIRAACELIDASLIVCKQATLIVPDLPESERKRCRYEYHGFDHDAHVRAFDEVYRVIEEEIPETNILDVTSISGVPEYFFDHIHPTSPGTTEIARIVAARVSEGW